MDTKAGIPRQPPAGHETDNLPPFVRRAVAAVSAVLLVAALVNSFGVRAQQATPIATEETAAGTTVYPASIHEGTCEVLGPVAFPLADVGVPKGGEIVGQPAIPAYEGTTILPNVKLDDLIFGQYVVAVSASSQDLDTIVACGDIGGTLFGDNLLFGLPPRDVPGIAGATQIVQLSDGSVQITVYVIISAALPETPTPSAQASPAAAQPTQQGAQPTATTSGQGQGQASSQVTIEMIDIGFNPSEVTIPANTDVTITLNNTGASQHNFSVNDRMNEGKQNLGISVDVPPGQTGTVTVNAPPGDYYFYCNVPGHEAAGMHGTMHVVQQ